MKKIILSVITGITVILLVLINLEMGGATGNGSNKMDLLVEAGDSPFIIAMELEKNNFIYSRKYFLFLTKITGNTKKFKQGIFTVNDGMSSWEIMQTIVGGKVKMVSFTIPEGYNNRQIGDLLAARGIVSSRSEFLKIASDAKILKQYNIPAQSVEGYLFPETYSVPVGYPAEKIAQVMIKMFYKKLKKVKNIPDKLSPQELQQKVILASIVEREAKKKEERPLMAGVFLRRNQIEMNLESCATVQYLFDKPKSRLFEKDLKIVSPYNTYLNKGFPPGPISNPGLPALDAAFNPVTTDKLFFVLKPDNSHYFSKTLKEHMDAKRKFLDSQR